MRAAKPKPAATAAAAPFRVVGKDDAPKGGKLNLGGLKKPSASSKKSDHPLITVNPELLQLLEQFAELCPEFRRLDALIGSKGSVKVQAAPQIRSAYFTHFAGRPPGSTMLVALKGGKTVKLVTKSRYSTLCPSLATLADAIDEPAAHFHETVVLKIEMEKIAEEKRQPLVDAILAAAADLGIEDGIGATECVQPNAGFHEARTTLFSPEVNCAIDAIIPVTAYPQL